MCSKIEDADDEDDDDIDPADMAAIRHGTAHADTARAARRCLSRQLAIGSPNMDISGYLDPAC